MGISSAMATSLTGLSAAETTISVVGNNLSNANTVGFKASRVSFATQFLQTLSLGAAPGEATGGTNPRQIGLGVMVSQITPDHTQGTLEISSRPTDLAIQGDGFFIVEGTQGEELYTRNGEFQFNSSNELVTTTGNRVLGYGVDDDYEIQRTTLEPIVIPLGSEQVAEATENVWLEGSLSPDGELSTFGTLLQSQALGDGSYGQPAGGPTATAAPYPDTVTAAIADAEFPLPAPPEGGVCADGLDHDFVYRFVYVQGPPPVYGSGTNYESNYVNEVAYTATAPAVGNYKELSIDITCDDPALMVGDPPYNAVRVYRAEPSTDPDFYLVDEVAIPAGGGVATFTDAWSQANLTAAQPVMDTSRLTGPYEYYVTFANATEESRPCVLSGSLNPTNQKIMLTNIPTAAPGVWTERRIYRTEAGGANFYQVGTISNINGTETFIDYMDDATLITQPPLDLDGPKIQTGTLLVDVISRDGSTYENVFQADTTLVFSAKKGGQTASTREMDITATTTISDLTNFMTEAMGIQSGGDIPDGQYPNPTTGVLTTRAPGVWADNTTGYLMVLGNTGTGNELDINLSGVQARLNTGVLENVDLSFTQQQEAVGESAVTDFLVYDTLGMPVTVRLTATLVDRDNSATTYRWYADSADNDPATGSEIAVGTGLLTFDGEGNFISATQDTVTIDRRHIASSSPLEFDIDFSAVSGLATDTSIINVSRQDGSAPGVLASFLVGEDGTIRGIFSNGLSRDLGKLQLARFSNPQGLEAKGENLYGEGINSGLPVQSDPGANGLGKIIAGSLELSNTDIGKDLIKLILASTMYRSNTRVISTSQEMLNELLAIRTG